MLFWISYVQQEPTERVHPGCSHPVTPEEPGTESELGFVLLGMLGDSRARSWAECGLGIESCLESLVVPIHLCGGGDCCEAG
jgi:hypothetical protein